jgi:hypothetical protein
LEVVAPGADLELIAMANMHMNDLTSAEEQSHKQEESNDNKDEKTNTRVTRMIMEEE